MSLIFIHRPPAEREMERFRLVLSTYQDGTGQLTAPNNLTLPGWRDFELSVAFAFGGEAQENKAIFDVLLADPYREGIRYGISCKMRKTLKIVQKTGHATLELSNSSGKFWRELKLRGLNEETYVNHPERTGEALIDLVESWYNVVSISNMGNIDLEGSFHLALQWDQKTGYYQLFQFPLKFPSPASLKWEILGRRLIGKDDDGPLFEWYGHSGGQLKYYPLISQASWISNRFKLEPLPERDIGYGVLRKAAEYFPELWRQTQ